MLEEEGNTRTTPSQGPKWGPPGCAVFDGGPLGELWIAWVDQGIAMIRFDGSPPDPEVLSRLIPEASEAPLPARPLPETARDVLHRYFMGEPIDPVVLPVRLRGTKFQVRAWEALRRVPRGSVRTYAGLALDTGSPRAMRAIGMAMGANPIPIVVPCHRVIAKGLSLGGFSGGLPRKKILLALEGVKVEGDQVLPGQLDLL
jgi:O-6-methylguanine DNA methyltransferase